MKKFVIFIGLITYANASYAECPDGWEEIPLENATITESNAQCGDNTDTYYKINEMCSDNIL